MLCIYKENKIYDENINGLNFNELWYLNILVNKLIKLAEKENYFTKENNIKEKYFYIEYPFIQKKKIYFEIKNLTLKDLKKIKKSLINFLNFKIEK